MSNNERQHWKRELDRANGNIDAALEKLLSMAEAYRALHPDYSEAIESIMLILAAVQGNITAIKNAV